MMPPNLELVFFIIFINYLDEQIMVIKFTVPHVKKLSNAEVSNAEYLAC